MDPNVSEIDDVYATKDHTQFTEAVSFLENDTQSFENVTSDYTEKNGKVPNTPTNLQLKPVELDESEHFEDDTQNLSDDNELESYGKPMMGEWSKITRVFQDFGLPQVQQLHQTYASSEADIVQLNAKMTRQLRENIESLIRDCQSKRDHILQLVGDNHHLREELDTQIKVTERFEGRVKELQHKFDSANKHAKSVEQELNSVSLSHDSDSDKLLGKNADMRDRIRALLRLVDEKSDDIDKLQEQLDYVKKQLKQRGVPSVLLPSQRPKHVVDDSDRQEDKALIKLYEKDLRDCKKRIKALETDLEVATLDMDNRPSLKQYRKAQCELKDMRASLKSYERVITELEEQRDRYVKGTGSYSTSLEELDTLPLTYCRATIKLFCQELEADDVGVAVKKLKSVTQADCADKAVKKFVKQVVELTRARKSLKSAEHEVWCDKTAEDTLQTLHNWKERGNDMKELVMVVKRLVSKLTPWRGLKLTPDGSTMQDVCAALEKVMTEYQQPSSEGHPMTKKQALLLKCGHCEKESAPPEVLREMIDYYMTLFEVKQIGGCYASMNDIYRRFGEARNVMSNLKELLALDRKAKSQDVIDEVSCLLRSERSAAHKELSKLLPLENPESVLRKVQIHDEYFPVLKDVIQAAMDIAGVNRIEQLVPAVEAMKLLAR